MRDWPHQSLVFGLIFLSMLLGGPPACKEKTDKDLILELMDRIGREVESQKTDDLLARLTEDYRDFEGRDKSQTEALLKDYFARTHGVVMHVLSTRIDDLDSTEASIWTEVALSSGAARILRSLIEFSTENYRFGLKLVKDRGEWKIRYAEWQFIRMDELYPESMSIFKEVFRDP